MSTVRSATKLGPDGTWKSAECIQITAAILLPILEYTSRYQRRMEILILKSLYSLGAERKKLASQIFESLMFCT